MYEEYADVLEVVPREEHYKNGDEILEESILQAIDKFLSENLKNRIPLESNICISLSGGVDSMVIATCLNRLKGKYNAKIIAAHVEYGNRSESEKEAQFVELWCTNNNIVFEKEMVTHIKRNEMERTEYEEESRQLRFGLYKRIIDKYQCPAIFLGHHAGDIAENVFTNIIHGRDLLDLEVIHSNSVNSSIIFWRPLVLFYKDKIFEFANKYQIPYFKDTTPDWSNRGVLRRQLFPKFAERYGGNFKKNLVSIGKQSTEWSYIIEKSVIDPFMTNKVKIGRLGAAIEYADNRHFPLCFWNIIFRKILHSMGISMATNKTMENLIEILQSDRRKCQFTLKSELLTFITDSSIVITKYNCLPDPKEKIYQEIDLENIGRKKIINLNQCELIVEIIRKYDCPSSQQVDSLSNGNYMDGQLIYFLPAFKSMILSNKSAQIDSNTKDKLKPLSPFLSRYLPTISANKKLHGTIDSFLLKITINVGLKAH